MSAAIRSTWILVVAGMMGAGPAWRLAAGQEAAGGETAPAKAATKSSWLPFAKRSWSDKEGTAKTSSAAKLSKGEADKVDGEMSVARLAERRGQTAQAEKVFRALAQKHPQLATPHHRLGVIAAKQGRLQEAEQHLQTAVRLEPQSITILSDLGYLYHLSNRLDDAERVYRQGLSLDPDHQTLCNNFGMLLADQGRTAEAFAVFKHVNSEAEAHTNLGFMLAQRGELEQAKTHFNQALTLNSKLRPAASGLIQIAEREKATAGQMLAGKVQPERTAVAAPAVVTRVPVGYRLPTPETTAPSRTEAPVVRAAASVAEANSGAAPVQQVAQQATARPTVARSRVADEGDRASVVKTSYEAPSPRSNASWPVAPVPSNLNPHAATKPVEPAPTPGTPATPASSAAPSTKRVRIAD